MKIKRKIIITLFSLSVFFVAGCGTDTPTNLPNEPNTDDVSMVDEDLRVMLEDAKEQYENNQLDAAAGTLTILLQNDLSGLEEVKTEAEELLQIVNQAQATDEKNEQLTQTANDSKYKIERYSDLAAEEFKQDTGGDIVTATDEEIQQWLVSKSEETDRRVSSKDTSQDANEAKQSETLEEQEQVLTELTERIGIDASDYEYFIIKVENQLYQIEVRQSHAVEDVEISNMIGIFKYHFGTKSLEKLDPITGQYEPYTNDAV